MNTQKKVEWKDVDQILGMGGPWIGQLTIDGTRIEDDCIVDNTIYEASLNTLFFAKYISNSKWARDNYFVVGMVDMSSLEVTLSDESFTMIYLDSIEEGKLVYHSAFHGEFEKNRREIRLNDL